MIRSININQVQIPAILYKYRDWKNEFHKGLLTHNEIYFSSPKDFNDPYDCRITERFTNRTKEELHNYKEKLSISRKEETERMGFNFEEVKKKLEKNSIIS